MSDYTVETIEHSGYVGRIEVMDYAENPRELGDYHLAVLTQLSSGYVQPDGHGTGDDRIVDAWDRYGWNPDGRRIRNVELVERYARVCLDAAAVGWIDDPRSSSRIFGYITRADADTHGITDAQAALDVELAEYRAYCVGDVYGYVVEDAEGEYVDACYGYYGDHELPYMRDCIREAIDAEVAGIHAERVAMFRRLVGAA